MDHFYYKEWPDKSCPIESQTIIELIDLVKHQNAPINSSIVVHCSAGVGRTGTFIAIYILIEMLKETGFFNPKKLVIEMRKQRAFLVQNWVKLMN